MIPLPLINGDTLLIDSSSTSDVMTCKRMAQYAFCLHKRSTQEKAALRAGGIAHKALEVRYRAASEMHAQTPAVESVMVAAVEQEYAGWAPPEDDFRTLSCMVQMIREYGLKYPLEPFSVLSGKDGAPFVEVSFAFPFAEIEVDADFLVQPLKLTNEGLFSDGAASTQHVGMLKIMWIGRIDLGYRTDAGVYIMDHKTSTMATSLGEFVLSHQLYGYVAAAEYLLQEPVQGVVINRIVWRKPTKTGTPFAFERQLIPTSRRLLDEWRQDCLHIIADLVETIRRGYMQKETVWCFGKFGRCPFHPVCTLDSEEQRMMMLNSGEYMENTWSPLQ